MCVIGSVALAGHISGATVAAGPSAAAARAIESARRMSTALRRLLLPLMLSVKGKLSKPRGLIRATSLLIAPVESATATL